MKEKNIATKNQNTAITEVIRMKKERFQFTQAFRENSREIKREKIAKIAESMKNWKNPTIE